MTESQLRFKNMVDDYPTLSVYWDFNERSVLIENSDDLPLSSGEKIILDFFISVWRGKNNQFDLIRAAGVLSNNNKAVICEWFLDPFWP